MNEGGLVSWVGIDFVELVVGEVVEFGLLECGIFFVVFF